MPTTRRTQPLPLPGVELARLKDQLEPRYGSHLWEQDGHRILVVRVPRDEPDIVNDLEEAVQVLAPADVAGTSNLLLVGHRSTHMVPVTPLQDLMAARVQFDRIQCARLRAELKPGEHRLWKAAEDPRKLVRMAVRVPCASVQQLEEADLLGPTAAIAPQSGSKPYSDVRAVYVIADKDEVRIDADLFFQDLAARHREQEERRRLAAEIVAKEHALRPVPDPLASPPPTRSRAPPTSIPDGPPQRIATAPLRRLRDLALGDDREAMLAHLDALPPVCNPAERAELGLPPLEAAPTPAVAVEAPKPILARPELAALKAALERCGYDVLVQPPTGYFQVDLAGERAGAYPQRVLGYAPARLDAAVAAQVLAAARALEADAAIVVAAEADPDAKRGFIATKARHVHPAELEALRL
ncbi:MAG: hypothetical protein QOD77_440 [Thermoplasmata archaeon]|jgi:hypothetical protein|nr:hypothetical protein [Thermoplasmata archaeon]